MIAAVTFFYVSHFGNIFAEKVKKKLNSAR
jgi:hypothetical protein